MKSFEIVTTFRYKGRIMKLFNIRKFMVLVSVSIHEARISRTFFGGLKASRRWKLKKLIILENIKSNELSLVFSKIVSKGLWCDKVWGISIFSSCTSIRGIYRKSLLRNGKNLKATWISRVKNYRGLVKRKRFDNYFPWNNRSLESSKGLYS